MLEEFVDSVLIIDDNYDEIKDLEKVLDERDIWVTYMNPPKEKQEIASIPKPLKNRKLVFLDLRIDETKKTIENISVIIRPLLKKIIAKDFGSYGIVMWTKHDNHISEFKEKIQNDAEYYQLPLFIVQMDKSKYLKEKSFDNVLNDLQEILKKNIAANFFITWTNLINKGKDNAIKSIFELIPDYKKQNSNLEFLLFKMGQNYTGIHIDNIDSDYPLSTDAIKSFNDLLVYEVNSLAKGIKLLGELNKIKYITIDDKTIQPTTKLSKAGDELTILFSELNSKILIDFIDIKQETIIPGNVYEIKDKNSNLICPDLPDNAKPIIIEMTPPCDFSNKKTHYPKVMSGYIQDYNKSKKPNNDKFYKDLWPVKLKELPNPQIIVFNFSILGFVNEDDLKNNKKYNLIFRVKDKLFADILQKMSAYNARLGLSIIR